MEAASNRVGEDGGGIGLRQRLRRVRSTSMAEEIVTENEKQRRAQPDKP
jgi:hypothetical protein